MIDHIAIKVSNFERSRDFYKSCLAPLGYTLLMEHDISGAGFGKDMKPSFWIQPGTASGPIHLAFSSSDRKSVDELNSKALF